MNRFALIAALAIAGCGPSVSGNHGDGGGGGTDGGLDSPDAYWGPTGTLRGTVWAPGNAPGMVPTGHEIPIFDAAVWVSLSRPDPIPQYVHCDQCVDAPPNHVFSDHDGGFTLSNLVPNTYWLVVQKGQFRLETQIEVTATTVDLPASQTTLPSAHDPDNGKWIPKIAIASGFWDHIEDILGKMGLGEVDGAGSYIGSSAAAGGLDVYSNDGAIDSVAIEPLSSFLADYDAMSQYHIIFIPCSTQTWTGTGLSGAPNQVLENLRQYVSDGGKLYVTDWSGEYEDNIFPEQIRFASDHDTPASAWTGSSWNPGEFGSADGFSANESLHAYCVDDDLYQWLDGQTGPTAPTYTTPAIETYDARDFVLEGKYDFIEELIDVQLGVDDEGFPVIDSPKAWVIGDENGDPANCAGSGCSPETVTFEPVGCGRVLYSTYHTADNPHVGLVPQERVLLYLIMEIGVCHEGPIVL